MALFSLYFVPLPSVVDFLVLFSVVESKEEFSDLRISQMGHVSLKNIVTCPVGHIHVLHTERVALLLRLFPHALRGPPPSASVRSSYCWLEPRSELASGKRRARGG